MNIDFWGPFAIGVILGLAFALAGVGLWAATRGGSQRSELEEYKDNIAERLHAKGLAYLKVQTATQLVDVLAEAVKTVREVERCTGVNLAHMRYLFERFMPTSDQWSAVRQMVYPLIGELAMLRDLLERTGFEVVRERGKVIGLRETGSGLEHRVMVEEWEEAGGD